jgi:ABC-type uncharacterized transport system substrate-binding protein
MGWHVRGETRLVRQSIVAAIGLGAAVLALVGVFLSPASAQDTRPPYRVGVLNDARAANHPTVEGLKAGLRDLGFEEGRDVVFDVRLTDSTPERISVAAGALVKAGVDVIFTSNEATTLAAKAATQTIPIVFTLVGDPVAAGIVKSLARPDENLTGVSSLTTELLPKRLEAFKTLTPRLRRVWAIYHGADPASGAAITRALENSSRVGIEILPRAPDQAIWSCGP